MLDEPLLLQFVLILMVLFEGKYGVDEDGKGCGLFVKKDNSLLSGGGVS